MNERPTLSVAIIHDQRAGHLNPSLGIYDSLEAAYTTTLHQITTPNIKKWQISLLKKLSWYPNIFNLCASLIFKVEPAEKINCIICSGMPNLLYSIYLSHKWSVPLFYAGDLRKVNSQLVNCTITALEQKSLTDQVVLATPPVKKVFFEMQNDPLDQNKALLILGGSTDEHPFTTPDFEKMILKFISFCTQHSLNGLITNSRRTPDLTSCLKKIKFPKNIQLHFSQDKQALSLIELIRQSTYIFVTEDSTSMIAEAIQSGRYVSSIYTAASTLEVLNKKYLDQKLMSRQNLAESFQIPNAKNTGNLDLTSPIIEAFKRNLGY